MNEYDKQRNPEESKPLRTDEYSKFMQQTQSMPFLLVSPGSSRGAKELGRRTSLAMGKR